MTEGFKTNDSTLKMTIDKGGLSKKDIERISNEFKAWRTEDHLNSARSELDSDIADWSIGTSFE